jgi:caa(3)-type oxidase subunit IV
MCLSSHKRRIYIGVYLALVALAMIELGITYLGLPKFPLMSLLLSVAFAKASLVVLYYMNLKSDSRLYAVILLVAVTIGAAHILALLL